MLLSCRRITGKCNTGSGCLTHITKCHHLYVYSSSPGIWDIVVTTIYIGTRIVPGTEYRFDRFHQLNLWICREVCTDLFFIFCLELISQLFQIFCCQLYVLCYALGYFHLVNQFFKIFLSNFHNDIRKHLDKSAVAVPCPSWVAGFLSQDFYYLFIQTKIQNGIHHARHRCSCSGSDRYQQWIFLISKLLSSDLFHLLNVFHNLALNFIVNLLTIFIILSTCFRCNREALWYRKSQIGHLSQIRALSSKKVSHVRITFSE